MANMFKLSFFCLKQTLKLYCLILLGVVQKDRNPLFIQILKQLVFPLLSLWSGNLKSYIMVLSIDGHCSLIE